MVESLKALDWKTLSDHLNTLVLDTESGEKLVDLIMRAGAMVFRYPGKTEKRAAILDGAAAKIRTDLGDNAAEHAISRFALFELIDEGYAGLRGFIEALPMASWTHDAALSAYLSFVARKWSKLQNQVEKALRTSGGPAGPMLTAPDGERYGADAALGQLVNLMSMNVKLLAFGGKWFDADEIIRVPDLTAVTDVQIDQAGAADATAFAWQQWQLIEERCRFLDGSLSKSPSTDERFPPGTNVIRHDADGIGWEMIDLAANERLGDRLSQTFQDMMLKTNLPRMGKGIDPGAAMPPTEYISAVEVHTVVMLSEYLGLDVTSHPADLGGLRLIEWIRGFAVLQQLALDRLEIAADDIDSVFPRLTLSELEAILDRNGVVGPKASIFINHASFHKSSRDLYDAPILRGDGDWCRIAAPGLVGALILRLVLSTLANKEIDIEGKGPAFEVQFRDSLKAQGLSVYDFQANRAGGPFEYDALVPWGDYLFVFECKNRSLSGSNPVASYNLLRSIGSHLKQVKRLAKALKDYPDILTEFVAEDCTNRTIVPVVMNSMPFSSGGSLEDVFFADAAAVGRFFEERNMHISQVHQVGEHLVIHRVPTHSQWAGETPTAHDFMRHLEDPLPLRIMMAHLHAPSFLLHIGPNLLAETRSPRRGEMTTESLAGLAGMTLAQYQAEVDRFVAEALPRLRASLGTDPKPAQPN
ncbi:NERD domain-containing protein [Rhizobium binae]|uniref:nuclease-related domain-containing protein n=1 Tax=Rhizobium binae TaxID=1138190 RepID=UPI001C829BDD|nr:nuclease-related domain-containing protein [Rhizobium binae]MBX4949601.1 NERD domain-containing protein [Rhizobium binae]